MGSANHAEPGCCKILSKGDGCDCTLCKQSREIEQLQAELARLKSSREIVLGEPVKFVKGGKCYLCRRNYDGAHWHIVNPRADRETESDYLYYEIEIIEPVEPPKPVELRQLKEWTVKIVDWVATGKTVHRFEAKHTTGATMAGECCKSYDEAATAWNNLEFANA